MPENRQVRKEGAEAMRTVRPAPEQDGVEVSAPSIPRRPATRATTTTTAQQPKQPKCPICYGRFKSEAAIDRHIDSCTGPETDSNNDDAILLSHTQTNPPRKPLPSSSNGPSNTFTPLPKINYTLYSEAKLRTVLNTLSLPTHGNKALLSARHKEYVNLYNANIDRRNPLPQHALLQQIREWEVVQARLSGSANGEGKRKEIDGVEWGRRFEGDFADLTRRARESTKRQKMDHEGSGEGESVGREKGQKGGDG